MIKNSLLSISSMMLLASCAGGGAGPIGIGAVVGDRNLAAAEPIFPYEEACFGSPERMLAILHSGNHDKGQTVQDNKVKSVSSDDIFETKCKPIILELRATLEIGKNSGAPYDRQQRNELIDAMIASSNRKCGRYTSLLKNADGAMNSSLGILAITTSGLGAIVGGIGAAKALSGTSAILSGSRAELNEVYLNNQTIQLLAAAFENSRHNKRKQITNLQDCSIEQYTLMRGIEDAFEYHKQCSIVVGLAEATRSIERSENPGIRVMREQFQDLSSFQRQVENFGKDEAQAMRISSSPVDLSSLIKNNENLQKAENELTAHNLLIEATKTNIKALSVGPVGENETDKNARKERLDDATKKIASLESERADKQQNLRDLGLKRDDALLNLVGRVPIVRGSMPTETRKCPYT